MTRTVNWDHLAKVLNIEGDGSLRIVMFLEAARAELEVALDLVSRATRAYVSEQAKQ